MRYRPSLRDDIDQPTIRDVRIAQQTALAWAGPTRGKYYVAQALRHAFPDISWDEIGQATNLYSAKISIETAMDCRWWNELVLDAVLTALAQRRVIKPEVQRG